MKKFKLTYFIFFLFTSTFFVSCDKGYQIRFANYYLEPMDSVVIGNKEIIFTNIPQGQTTEFKKISKGRHTFTLTTKSKKKYSSSFFISGKGNGNRTIEIDAIEQVFVLEE